MSIPLLEEQSVFINEAVKCKHLSRGPHLNELTNKLKKMFKKKYVYLTSNGFSALFLSLLSIEDSFNTINCVSASTCFAMVNAIISSGYKVNFLDIEQESFSLNPNSIKEVVENGYPIIIPDHFGMIPKGIIKQMSDTNIIIEDAAQSFLSRLKIDTCSDITTLSFYPTKIINGIDGGAILTNNKEIYERIINTGDYDNQDIFDEKKRYNFRMQNINAAFLLGTIEKLDYLISDLQAIYSNLYSVIDKSKFVINQLREDEIPSKFIINCDSKSTRDKLLVHLSENRVEASKELKWVCKDSEKVKFGYAAKGIENSLSIPFYPKLSEKEIMLIKKAFDSF